MDIYYFQISNIGLSCEVMTITQVNPVPLRFLVLKVLSYCYYLLGPLNLKI